MGMAAIDAAVVLLAGREARCNEDVDNAGDNVTEQPGDIAGELEVVPGPPRPAAFHNGGGADNMFDTY